VNSNVPSEVTLRHVIELDPLFIKGIEDQCQKDNAGDDEAAQVCYAEAVQGILNALTELLNQQQQLSAGGVN